MRTNEIIREIQKLPIAKRIYVVEKTILSIRKEKDINAMKTVTDLLFSEHKIDSDLTVFTKFDFEGFYEGKMRISK